MVDAKKAKAKAKGAEKAKDDKGKDKRRKGDAPTEKAKAKAKGHAPREEKRERHRPDDAAGNRPTMTCELGGDRPRPPGPTWRDANPRAALPRLGAKMQEVDPGYTYDVRTFSGGSWIKVGEVWHDASAGNKEYWGLDSYWYDKILDLWMYPIGSNSYYSNYTAFKSSINSQFPSNTRFYVTKTIV